MAEAIPEKQRSFALDVVGDLRRAGFEAYWAGGCVRDLLLGRTAKDYDVATSATPDEIRQVFSRRRTLALGAAFGVITVLGPRGAGQIEVTTFRQDSGYSDGRHPDRVVYTSAEEDARRRDFTINGLFLDPEKSAVIDYVAGQQDLERRLVRAIGNPRERFTEDKLRMLRAVRFAAVLDFALEAETAAAIAGMSAEILVVSPERIAAELKLVLTHGSRRRAVELLDEVRLLDVVLPEVDRARDPSAWRHTLAALERLAAPDFPLALATLLRAYVDRGTADEIGRRLRLSNRETARCGWLLEHAGRLAEAPRLPWPTLQRLLTAEGIADLVAFEEAWISAEGGDLAAIDYCRQQLARPAEELNPPPLLTGDDLVQIGIPRGKHYQRLLESARDAQLEQRVTTKAEALELIRQLHGGSPS